MITQDALSEFARIIEEKKPYLLEVEKRVQEVQHGKLIVEIDVRSGNVEKMIFEKKENWLREKAQSDIKVKTSMIVGFIKQVE